MSNFMMWMVDCMEVVTFNYIDLVDAVQTELRILNENNPQLKFEQQQQLSHFF